MGPHFIFSKAARRSQVGFSLVELMISLVIGLIVLGALVALFVNNSSTRRELDRSADVLENGNYALNLLRDELSLAGFYGTLATVSGSTDAPCSTALADWNGSMGLFVRGSNQTDTPDPFSSCTTNRKSNTDAVLVQRAATCTTGGTSSDCETLTVGKVYLQVSECGDEYSTTPSVLAAYAATSPFTLRAKNCTTAAPIRSYVRRIFYINTSNQLMQVDIGNGAVGTPQLIADGIENMQIEYGIDTTGDGSPDCFIYNSGVSTDSIACSATVWPPATQNTAPPNPNWQNQGPNIVGARLHLLGIATQATSGYVNDKTYAMADWVLTTAPGDAYKRRVFTTYINFVNPQGRRQ